MVWHTIIFERTVLIKGQNWMVCDNAWFSPYDLISDENMLTKMGLSKLNKNSHSTDFDT